MQKSLKILKIVILSLLGIAMLIFGILMLSTTLFFDDMDEKTYYEYVFDVPDSENKLIAKEYFSFSDSGVEFWMRNDKSEKCLSSVTTNEYFPFSNNDYKIIWEDNGNVDITYGFDSSVNKTIKFNLYG